MSMVQEVKNLCEKKGLTVTRLEKEIGLGRGTITRWDTNSPSIDKVILVSNYFGVPVSALVGDQTGQETDGKEKPTDQEDGGGIGPAKRELLDMVGGMNEKESAAILEVVKATIKMRDAKE